MFDQAAGPPGPGGHNNLSKSALAGLLILILQQIILIIVYVPLLVWDGIHVHYQK